MTGAADGTEPLTPRDVAGAVERAVYASPSFGQLDDRTRAEIGQSLAAVTRYLRADPLAQAQGAPVAHQLAPDLSSLRRTGQPPSPAAAPAEPLAPSSSGAPSSSPVGRVGEVTRSTLDAIDFPNFVSGLIQGTFQAIVDSSIQQMQAYAEMLKQVAGTVDQFMSENVSDGQARDYLADRYGDVLTRSSASGAPRLSVNPQAQGGELPSFFSDLGFAAPEDLSDDTVEDVVVPAARRSLAEQRQQTLATMVMMGINRVVVSDGEITAKLVFHVDASETTEVRFDQTKTTVGSMAKTAGTSPFSAQAILVNTTNVNAQSDINVRTDLTGQVGADVDVALRVDVRGVDQDCLGRERARARRLRHGADRGLGLVEPHFGRLRGIHVEDQLRGDLAVADHDTVDAHHHHRGQRLLSLLGERAPRGRDDHVLHGVVAEVLGRREAEVAEERRELATLCLRIHAEPGRTAGRAAGQHVAVAVREVVPCLPVADVLAHELVDRAGDLLEHLRVGLHLLDAAVDDRLERPLDQARDEVGKVDGVECGAGDLTDPTDRAAAGRTRRARRKRLRRRCRR